MKQLGKNRLTAFILLLIVVYGGFLSADEKKESPQASSKNWSLSIRGGITLNTGNTESKLYTGGVDFDLKIKKIEYLTNLEAFYGAGKNIETVNKGKWYHKVALKGRKRFGVYTTLTLEYDKFAQIAFRGNAGLGARLTLKDTPKTVSHLAAGLNGEFTDALSNIANMSSFRFNLNYTLKKAFSPTTKFDLDLLHTSNWGSFFNDYRFEMKASLSTLIKNPFNLKIEVQDKFTNHPLEDSLKKNDFILVTSLEISL